MASTLITIATDGFRDYVDLPDGRQINLGSVSVLKLVTSLVRGSTTCRRALDTFLKKKVTTVAVDLQALESLLKPRRSRWAGYGDSFIPADSQHHSRGASMDPVLVISSHLDSIENLLKAASQEPIPVSQLIELVANLTKAVQSSSEEDSCEECEEEQKLASIESVLEAMHKAGSVEGRAESIKTLQVLASEFRASVSKEAAVDQDAMDALEEYLMDDSSLDKQRESILKNILRKKEKGKYNASSDVKLWAYFVETGAKRYCAREDLEVRDMFPKALCDSLASKIAKKYDKAIEAGDYDTLKTASAQTEDQADSQSADQSEDTQVEQKTATQDEGTQEAQQEQSKEAAMNLSDVEINEALAHSVMAKIEGALEVVESSTKSGTQVAKGDLNKITTRLASLIETSDLGDPNLRTDFKKLACMAEQVHSYFAV